jgi:hypothetical protein
VSPAWATRYFAIFVGPMLLLIALTLARAGRLGLIVLAAVALLWWTPRHPPRDVKSDARPVGAELAPVLRAGDLVVSTHPEQVPLLHYYMRPGLRYADSRGPVGDPSVMDWRDALPALKHAEPRATAERLVDSVPRGSHLVLVRPVIGNDAAWHAPWTRLVRLRSAQWARVLRSDSRLRAIQAAPTRDSHAHRVGVRAIVYEKVRR